MPNPDWDVDSNRLRENLVRVLSRIRDAGRQRLPLRASDAAGWHAEIMEGLAVPDPAFVGAFRGQPGLEDIRVMVGPNPGSPPGEVAAELAAFDTTLQRGLQLLDTSIPAGAMPDEATLGAVIDLCAWAHAQWIQIHPFANGSGRTARLWANAIAMRYELPPFVRLRPRPNHGYEAAAQRAMQGDWEPTVQVFRAMLDAAARGQ